MSDEFQPVEIPLPPTPRKKRAKAKKRIARAAKPPKEADQPVISGAGEFAGISATRCPSSCTEKRCVISTTDVCKHPFKTGDNGCGPITMENRARAKKLIRHQMIDMKE